MTTDPDPAEADELDLGDDDLFDQRQPVFPNCNQLQPHINNSVLNHIPGPAGKGTISQTPGILASPSRGIPREAALGQLAILEFNEASTSCVQAALDMSHSGVFPRLLVYVVSLQQAFNGESYVKLSDGTGCIGATFTSDVLVTHPSITRDALLYMKDVTVLRSPPPHKKSHLCILPTNIVRVFARRSFHGGLGDEDGLARDGGNILHFGSDIQGHEDDARQVGGQSGQGTIEELPSTATAPSIQVAGSIPHLNGTDDLMEGLDDDF